MSEEVPREPVAVARTRETMNKVKDLTDKFPYCSLEFLGFVETLSDEDVKHTFKKLKEVVTAEGVFGKGTAVTRKYLQVARIMFNSLTPLEKAEYAKLGLKHARLKKTEKKNGICQNDDHRNLVRETVAMNADGWKSYFDFGCLQSTAALPCPLCEEEQREFVFREPMDFVEHVVDHRCLSLYGCHICHHLFSSVEAYHNHTCQGVPGAPRKKPRIEREFKSLFTLLACVGCGHTMNVYAKASQEEKKKQMEDLRALQLNHNCSHLMAVRIITTDDCVRSTDRWKVEFSLRNGDVVRLPKECCGEHFERLDKFKQHMFNHLSENGKMAAFLDATEIKTKQKEVRHIPPRVTENVDASKKDSLTDAIKKKLPRTAESMTFNTDWVTINLSSMTFADLHIRPTPVEAEMECKISFEFASVRPEGPVITTIADRTFVCCKCSSICIGDECAIAHFRECNPSGKDDELTEDFVLKSFDTLTSRFALPNASVQCLTCDVECCSLSGYSTHMALRHNQKTKLCEFDSSIQNWLYRKEPSSAVMSINEFSGLTDFGILPATLEEIYKPRPKFEFGTERRHRRRADVFQQPPDLAAEENDKTSDGLVPDGKEANCTLVLDNTMEISVSHTTGISEEEKSSDATMSEETEGDEEGMEEGEIRDEEEQPTENTVVINETTMDGDVLETAFSEDPTMVADEKSEITDEVEPPAPIANGIIDKSQPNANDTMLVFQNNANDTMAMFSNPGPSGTPANITMDMFPQAANADSTNATEAESAMRVAQLWDEGRKSRETPPPENQEKIDVGCRCFDCGLLLKDEEALKSHLKAHESGSAPLAPSCHLCPEKADFKDPNEFMHHLCYEHAVVVEKNNGKAYQCKFCEREFPAHILVAHLIFDCSHSPCGLCKEPLQNMIHIEREKHRKKHRVYKRFGCHCKMEFTNFVLFNNHVCAHDDKKLVLIPETFSKELLVGIVPEHPSVKRYIEDESENRTPAIETIRSSDTITIVENVTDVTLNGTVTPIDILSMATRDIDLSSPLLPPPPLAPNLHGSTSPSPSNVSTDDSVDSTIVSTPRDVNRGVNSFVAEAYAFLSQRTAPDGGDDAQVLNGQVDVVDISDSQGPSTSRMNDTDVLEVVERTASADVSWNAVQDDDEIQMAEIPQGVKTVSKTREKKFKCGLCSSAFYTKTSLECHKEKLHSSDISGQEKLCLEDHGVPLTGTFHLCLLCSAAFESPSRYSAHTKTHETRKHHIVACNDCSGIQLSLDNMGAHIANHQKKLLRYRCVQCEPNVMFYDDSAYMMHALETHKQAIVFYCKNCFIASCEPHIVHPHVAAHNCRRVFGGIDGLGFALSSQLNYQPMDENHLKRLNEMHPAAFAKSSTCSHKAFLRFGQKFTSCPDGKSGKDCMGLVNYHQFENHVRASLHERQMHLDVDLPENVFPQCVYAVPGYDLNNFMKHRFQNAPLFPFMTTAEPPNLFAPNASPANRPSSSRNNAPNPAANGRVPAVQAPSANERVPAVQAPQAGRIPVIHAPVANGRVPAVQAPQAGRVQAPAAPLAAPPPQSQIPQNNTPQLPGVPIPGMPMPRQIVPGMQSPLPMYNQQPVVSMYGNMPMMMPMPGAPIQHMPMQQPQMQPMPMQQPQMPMQQQVALFPLAAQAQQMGFPAPYLGCIVCGTNGAMPPMMMVTIRNLESSMTKAFTNLVKGTDSTLPDRMAKEIQNRLTDRFARLCWSHVNPHCVQVLPGQVPSIDVDNVCFEYVDFTNGILKNREDYKKHLQLFVTHSREPHMRFNIMSAVSALTARNICGYEHCGKSLASNAIIGLHRAHTDNELKHACGICKSIYESADSVFVHLTSHFPNVQNVQYKLQCPLCAMAPIQDMRLFLYHLKKHHADVLKEPAMYCISNLFASPEAQKHHDNLHMTVDAYQHGECCHLCGVAKATEVRNLPAVPIPNLNHVIIHHSMNRVYSCRLCFDDLRTRKSLAEHLVQKHGYSITKGGRQCTLCMQRSERGMVDHAIEAHTLIQYRLFTEAQNLVVVVDPELLRAFLGLPF